MADPAIRTVVVLERGRIVVNYQRDEAVDPNMPYQVWSTTKSWIGMLIGIAVASGELSLNDTLGDIFAATEDGTVWSNVTDAEFKKAVTIESVLSMTSGLVMAPPGEGDSSGDVTLAFDGGVAGGRDLQDSLNEPSVGVPGIFFYLTLNNILSYVIEKRTGLSPRAYLAGKVLPALGINDSEINWWRNKDGMEYSYHGLELTTLQMAKFGQLYLQNGKSSPETQLVPEEWVSKSIKGQAELDNVVLPPNTPVTGEYGYLLWLPDYFQEDNVFCALGFGGQNICVSRDLERVIAKQKDFVEESDMQLLESIVMDSSVSFESDGSSSASLLVLGPITLLVASSLLSWLNV
mmetsp:Transcript_22480/g.48819  ORF Transcript_22480/g.48819 Transcript_22480/m.48819 type:complete len:348 (+) Transcript_22480:399-1442(+)